MKNKVCVLLDNGHGNNTAGKRSPDGTLMEWKYTREIVYELYKMLEKHGIWPILLVPEDTDISLTERVNRANQWYDDLKDNYQVFLISVHCNAAPPDDGKWHNARGWSAYTSIGLTESDRICKCLYDAADVYLEDYKNTFTQADIAAKQRPIRDTRTDSRGQEANFAMLYRTKCPAVLTENLFQDNVSDITFLLSQRGKQSIIDLHFAGIVKYVESLGITPSIITK